MATVIDLLKYLEKREPAAGLALRAAVLAREFQDVTGQQNAEAMRLGKSGREGRAIHRDLLEVRGR